MQEQSLRNRITVFTFALTILVIWVHSVNMSLPPQGEGFAAFAGRVEDFFTNRLGQTAVPGFFMVSAYLFFRKAPEHFSGAFVLKKWKRRAFTVLLPYLLWNLLYYVGRLMVSRCLGTLPGEPGYVPLDGITLYRAVVHYLYNPVFWYLQELILLILLAPLIWLLVKNRIIGILFLLAAFFGAANWQLLPLHPVNEDALFYFSLGSFAAFHGRPLLEEGKGALGALLGSAGLLLLYLLFHGRFEAVFSGSPALLVGETVAFRALFPAFLFFLLTVLSEKWAVLGSFLERRELPAFMQINFLIYATHYILVRCVNGALQRGLETLPGLPSEGRTAVLLLCYLLLPAFCVACGLLGSRILGRLSPGLRQILTGGR